MKPVLKQAMKFFVIVMIIGYLGCASVPKEVVELSYTVGEDLNAVHVSYKHLIRLHFAGLRKQLTDFLDDKWTPVYLNNFITRTSLVEKLKTFKPDQVLIYLQKWVQVATNEIQKKKKQLLGPIEKDERKLLADVDQAFGQLTVANAAITANLNSIRKVKALEDKTLSTLRLKNFRDKVTDFMAGSSKRVQDAINLLDKGGKILDKADEEKKKLVEKTKELLKKKKDETK